MTKAIIGFVCLIALIVLAKAQRQEDEVFSIPDQENIKNLSSKWYSGYFNVTKYKKLHYVFVDSLNKPETDPIIIVFNGGPGGPSTFLAFQLSPYVATSFAKNLSDFPETWARNASLLFIDNPAGVGFSYAQRDTDYAVNENSNMNDVLKFLFQFYSFWPSRTANPLYIFGISYGGMYAPMLAWGIHNSNQEVSMNVTQRPHINLKGFIVTNGVTDLNKDPFIGSVDQANAHNIIPNDLYESYKENQCRFYWQNLKIIDREPCPQMMKWIAERNNEINIYNLKVTREISTTLNLPQRKKYVIKDSLNDLLPNKVIEENSCEIEQNLKNLEEIDIFGYLNTPEFRKAFHVYEGKGTVYPSTPKVYDNFKTQAEGSNWIYDIFAKYGYRMLYIQSDTDGILSLSAAWKWIKDRKFTVKTPWTPWFSKFDGQLAGYIKEYHQNFTFATIHGEGHSGVIDRSDIGPDLILKFVLEESLT